MERVLVSSLRVPYGRGHCGAMSLGRAESWDSFSVGRPADGWTGEMPVPPSPRSADHQAVIRVTS